MNVKVVCVKWGKKFSSLYVNKLYAMVERNLTVPHRLICMTDDPAGLNPNIEIIALENRFEYCWNKIELFKPHLFSNEDICLFLDLDIVITDNINELITYQPEKKFISILDWNCGWINSHYNSSVMRFQGDCHTHLYTLLISKLENHSLQWKREYDAYLGSHDKVVLWDNKKRYGSDQEWISEYVYSKREIRKNRFPKSWMQSYKRHARTQIPKQCKIIVFHGFPKPHEVDNDYVKRLWQSL